MTDLKKEELKIDNLLKAFTMPMYSIPMDIIHGTSTGLLIQALCKSYLYWASREGNAFKLVENLGYGFPFTNKRLNECLFLDEESKEGRKLMHNLKSMGLFTTELLDGVGDYKVNYYFINIDKCVNFVQRTRIAFEEDMGESIKLIQEIKEAKSILESAEVAYSMFKKEQITKINMITDTKNEPLDHVDMENSVKTAEDIIGI